MQKQAIIVWASEVCTRVSRGIRNEDSRVELKGEWIDAKKAARRIAGHANSMRGEPILWIFGVDEKVGIVGLADTRDPGEWYASARSVFDGAAPDLGGIVTVEFDGKELVAMQLNTDSAPYVVKNVSGDGPIQFEVPWRDGTLLRSAHQRELLQILLPIQRLPTFEPIEATLIANQDGGTLDWRAEVIAFVEPATPDYVTVPFHRMEVVVKRHDGSNLELTLSPSMMPVAQYELLDPRRIWATSSEVIIGCPGRVRITARGYDPITIGEAEPEGDRRIVIRVLPTHAQFPRTFEVTLVPSIDRASHAGHWVFPSHRQDERREKNMPVINLPNFREPRMLRPSSA